MTQADKDLLLKDLCARLPYSTFVNADNGKYREDVKLEPYMVADIDGWQPKPYLRPMSSMTEEEKDTYDTMVMCNASWVVDDWLNAHYLDYRDLIGKGLAIEAPKYE